MFHFLSAFSHRRLSWQLQQFDEERKWQPINHLFLKTYFLHLKKRSALELPKLTIFGQPSLSFSWVMNASIKCKASTNHTASLVRASYTHCICTSGCRMHRGLTETHRSHACHHIFHTVVQWFEVGRVVPLSQDPKEVKGTLNSSGLNTIPTQTGAQEALTDKSKNCVFDCTKPQNFDKLIQKRDA